jgi:hypothetical protein
MANASQKAWIVVDSHGSNRIFVDETGSNATLAIIDLVANILHPSPRYSRKERESWAKGASASCLMPARDGCGVCFLLHIRANATVVIN